MVGRILKENQNLELAAINCDIGCQIGSSPIENFHCKAKTGFAKSCFSCEFACKSQRKDFLATLELGLRMILPSKMRKRFKIDGRMLDEKQKITD